MNRKNKKDVVKVSHIDFVDDEEEKELLKILKSLTADDMRIVHTKIININESDSRKKDK